MKKTIILPLLFLVGIVYGQESLSTKYNYQDFMLLEKVEDQESYYNQMRKQLPEDNSKSSDTDVYRAELAFAWLAKGDVKKYMDYKSTAPEFNARQFLYLVNALEDLFDERKDYVAVEAISSQLLQELQEGVIEDVLSRTAIIMELNAAANAKLGNIEQAQKMILASAKHEDSSMRTVPYFKDMSSNYLNRYAIVLSAAGQHQEALDTLTAAFRNADSNPYMAVTFSDVYQKVHGTTNGMEDFLSGLKEEAYRKYYKEVESRYIEEPQKILKGSLPSPDDPTESLTLFTASKPVQEIVLENLNKEAVRLADDGNKIIVLDFWTTLCTPCVAAFSGFDKVVAEYSPDELQLYVTNIFEDHQTVKSYVVQKGITLDVLRDEENVAYNIQGTPTKLVFDMDGNIRFYDVGYAGSTDREYYKLKSMIEITKERSKNSQTVAVL